MNDPLNLSQTGNDVANTDGLSTDDLLNSLLTPISVSVVNNTLDPSVTLQHHHLHIHPVHHEFEHLSILRSSSDSNSQPYTTIDSFNHVNLHAKDGYEYTVGRVENQEFWATPYDHTDYVSKLTSDWHILDTRGDCVGYVDNNCVVHKPDGDVVYEGANSALNAAAWMLFVGMGGKS